MILPAAFLYEFKIHVVSYSWTQPHGHYLFSLIGKKGKGQPCCNNHHDIGSCLKGKLDFSLDCIDLIGVAKKVHLSNSLWENPK